MSVASLIDESVVRDGFKLTAIGGLPKDQARVGAVTAQQNPTQAQDMGAMLRAGGFGGVDKSALTSSKATEPGSHAALVSATVDAARTALNKATAGQGSYVAKASSEGKSGGFSR